MSEPLSPADRSSLSAEQGPINMAVGGVMILTAGPGTSHAAILERVHERLHLIPRYRQRLESPGGGFINPVWVDDRGFEIGWHVRRTSLGGAGTQEELATLVGHEMSRRLDRSRPLWELTVVEGLAEGRMALLAKMHHALVDGVAAVDIGTVLLDPTDQPLELPPPDAAWAPQPYDRRRHLARLGVTPVVRAQKLAWESAQRALTPRDPRRLGSELRSATSDLRSATELLAELARTRPAAPMTPLNEPIGPNRRFAMTSAELAALKTAGKAAGGTVNDAILAVVAGALRTALGLDDGSPRPVALVPVSVRREGEEGGNRISTVLVDLPTDVADARQRVTAVHTTMARMKESAAVRAGAMLVGAAGWAPPLVSSGLARAMSGVRAFNVVVSNVPGPPMPLFMGGERLLSVHPAVPLNPSNQGLTVGVLSYAGGVHFGLLADRDLSPTVAGVTAALGRSLDELLATG